MSLLFFETPYAAIHSEPDYRLTPEQLHVFHQTIGFAFLAIAIVLAIGILSAWKPRR